MWMSDFMHIGEEKEQGSPASSQEQLLLPLQEHPLSLVCRLGKAAPADLEVLRLRDLWPAAGPRWVFRTRVSLDGWALHRLEEGQGNTLLTCQCFVVCFIATFTTQASIDQQEIGRRMNQDMLQNTLGFCSWNPNGIHLVNCSFWREFSDSWKCL